MCVVGSFGFSIANIALVELGLTAERDRTRPGRGKRVLAAVEMRCSGKEWKIRE